MNMDDSESRCRREAHGREPYKGHTGEQPPRMVGRLQAARLHIWTGWELS